MMALLSHYIYIYMEHCGVSPVLQMIVLFFCRDKINSLGLLHD